MGSFTFTSHLYVNIVAKDPVRAYGVANRVLERMLHPDRWTRVGGPERKMQMQINARKITPSDVFRKLTARFTADYTSGQPPPA